MSSVGMSKGTHLTSIHTNKVTTRPTHDAVLSGRLCFVIRKRVTIEMVVLLGQEFRVIDKFVEQW
jgi:hypothetical protein